MSHIDYSGDDYPRNGCTISIVVPDQLGQNWTVRIAAPDGRLLESYARGCCADALEAAQCLIEGKRVPQ